ncbi:glutaredoxin family protein [Neisseria sp. Ec49-e6-T10]|uniref:glutaredoxin family protein n=1 Tax=Neisseria sp. Ec49-e6-T10 TaxID=3140744 RepID=UPI003EB6F879
MILTLMFREYCHLCHQMRAQLQALQPELKFELNVVDVDANPALEALYNELVPVLMHEHNQICHWHLDESALRAYLAKLG